MYNFALAFFVCAAAFVIGEIVCTVSKAWIPSAFATAVVMLLGYWFFIPTDVVSVANLIPFGGTIGMYLMVVHMGSVISIKQLLKQWKVVLICLIGLSGMCMFAMIICPMVMDKALVIAGLPPLTGGIVATTMMQEAAINAGLEEAAVFAIVMYCMQGFVGYPLTAVCLQFEGKKLLEAYNPVAKAGVADAMDAVNRNLVTGAVSKKKLLSAVPGKYNTTIVMLGKAGLIAWIATQLGVLTGVSGIIWALVISVIAAAVGLLEENLLNKTSSYGIIMFALMMYIFDGLKDCTPEMLLSMIVPMIVLIVIGVSGMAVFCYVAARVLKMSFTMAFATVLTALYGFPPNAIITESTCEALAKTPEEKEYLMNAMFPAMIAGGFTTVAFASVIIANMFQNML